MKKIILNISRISKIILFLLLASCSSSDTIIEKELINISFTVNTEDILVGEPVLFNNSSNDNNINFYWDFGDSTFSNEKNPSHTYSQLGNYIVKLSAKNSNQEKSFSKEIIVSLSSNIPGNTTLKEKLNSLQDKIMVCAHRSIDADSPENSLAGIKKSITNKIEMIEIDIRQTKDGELVLMHDATIDRTTNGSGNVSNFTLQEIQQFNLYKQNGTLTNEKIPTLKEVFELSRGKVYINLDINDKAPFNRVYALAKQYGMLKQVQFYTKDDNLIRSMLLTNNDLVVLPYIDDETEFNTYNNTNLSIVHYSDNSFNSTLIDKAKKNGWAIYANVYVNTNTTPQSDSNHLIDKFIFLKGSVVQTDHPKIIKEYLQQKNLN